MFVGTFTAGDVQLRVEGGHLHIDAEGSTRKFVRQVEQRTFSGAVARAKGQKVLYVTERCVFRLADEGLELIEIAPGIDLKRDVLAHMDFMPAISPQLTTMDARLFADEPLGLRERLLTVPLTQRVTYQPNGRLLFIDFEGLYVADAGDIEEIERTVTERVRPLGHKVNVVVNYDHFTIRPELMDAYGEMVRRLEAAWYERITRYGASGFLKARLAGTG